MRSGVERGIPRHSEALSLLAPSTPDEMEAAVARAQAAKADWLQVEPDERAAILDRLLKDTLAVTDRWVMASLEAKGIARDAPAAAEEWLAGPFCMLRNIRLLRDAMAGIAARGRPRMPGPIWVRDDRQVVASVFPSSFWDRLFYTGVTAEIWMQPGVEADGLAHTQAVAYRGAHDDGRVVLVLGAGNVSSIGPQDTLHKLFIENSVVIYKAHPVNGYLGPLMAEAFRALVERGVLQVVHGGATEGEYLVRHPGVDEIHITGSDKTYEAIVYGVGADGERRKAERRPGLGKRVSAELGNVSPVIVVPGPWRRGDIRYQAANIVSMLTNNAGFNCNTARVVVQHAGWEHREALLEAVRDLLKRIPLRAAYYPGSAARHARFTTAHAEAERFGAAARAGELPWTLIPHLDPGMPDEVCYSTEAFCGVLAETALDADGVPAFLDRAVRFCNERLWGTLNATIVVHPRSLARPDVREAVQRALANLRYGSVSLNHWSALAYALGVTTWGAFPGHPPHDIQSGTGVVHNTLMFQRPEKSVIRAPFRVWPTPPWFVTNKVAARLSAKLTRFEARPSVAKALGVLATAVRG
jgi:acyl-CoA reductase-like NAD-dependent aldehyde dehydrogenase